MSTATNKPKMRTCPRCDGNGYIGQLDDSERRIEAVDCPDCGGTGEVGPECAHCGEAIEGQSREYRGEMLDDECWTQMCREEGWCPGCGKELPSARWAMCRSCGKEM